VLFAALDFFSVYRAKDLLLLEEKNVAMMSLHRVTGPIKRRWYLFSQLTLRDQGYGLSASRGVFDTRLVP